MNPTPFDQDNLFAPPQSSIGQDVAAIDFQADPQAEEIRQKHLRHEASIKAIGLLCYLMATLFACGTIVVSGIVFGLFGDRSVILKQEVPFPEIILGIVLAFYAGLTTLAFALGFGLRRLQVWARFTMMVFAMIGLLYLLAVDAFLFLTGPQSATLGPILVLLFPALIQAYVFYLLVIPKSNMVFSAEYRLVIARTPHLKTRTSLIIKILIGLLVGLFVIGLIGIIGSLIRG